MPDAALIGLVVFGITLPAAHATLWNGAQQSAVDNDVVPPSGTLPASSA